MILAVNRRYAAQSGLVTARQKLTPGIRHWYPQPGQTTLPHTEIKPIFIWKLALVIQNSSRHDAGTCAFLHASHKQDSLFFWTLRQLAHFRWIRCCSQEIHRLNKRKELHVNDASFLRHPVCAEVQTVIESPRERTFAQIVPIDLPSIFRGLWPIPAVIGTRDQSGAWNQAGRSRTVLLSDNSTAQEVLLEVTPATHFSYRVEKFTGTLGGLAAHANGEWWFEQNGQSGQTVVRWRYEFIPKSRCSAVALKTLVALFWKRYMIKALKSAKALVESNRLSPSIGSALG